MRVGIVGVVSLMSVVRVVVRRVVRVRVVIRLIVGHQLGGRGQ